MEHYPVPLPAPVQVPMKKKKKPAAPLTKLDPSHPNHDAILLKQARLEAHRRRRKENSGALKEGARESAADKRAGTSKPRGKR